MAEPAHNQPAKFGRFEVQGILGSGAQGVVYLCLDPELDRKVAIKALARADGDDQRLKTAMLLREARTISKFQHPNVVSIYEAGLQDGAAFLVLEHVEGDLLSSKVRRGHPLPVDEVISLSMQIADALASAHERGIIHCDIKPQNIMLDARGAPKVMDFGTARIMAAAVEGDNRRLVGTPRYMAPEYIQHGRLTPAADIFAFGLVMHAMLTGNRVVDGNTVETIFEKLVYEDFPPPSASNPGIDPALDEIVAKALAKDPGKRYQDAGELRAALAAYRARQSSNQDDADRTTLQVLSRIRKQRDFPALSQRIVNLNLLFSGDPPVDKVAEVISRDMALANKLLRVVNSAFYSNAGGHVDTVSRAVVMLGFRTVRDIAASLTVVDGIGNETQSSRVRGQSIASMFAAGVAQQLARHMGGEDVEEIFLCAMFHRLGRLLIYFYLPEEADRIASLIEAGMDIERAGEQVLGLSPTELGQEIARDWCLPEQIVRSMEAPAFLAKREADGQIEQLQALGALCNDVADLMAASEPELLHLELRTLLTRYGPHMPVSLVELLPALKQGRKEFREFASVAGITTTDSPLAERLQQWPDEIFDQDWQDQPTMAGEATAAPTSSAYCGTEETPTPARGNLNASLDSMVADLLSGLDPQRVLSRLVRVICQRGGYTRSILCLVRPSDGLMRPCGGWGPGIDDLIATCHDHRAGKEDLFGASLYSGEMTYAHNGQSDPPLPQWYLSNRQVQELLILPVQIANRPVALLLLEQDARPGPRPVVSTPAALKRAARVASEALRTHFSR